LKWNDSKIEEAINVLHESISVAYACNEISDVLGSEITPSSLRKAFQRNGYDSPSNYLSTEEDAKDVYEEMFGEALEKVEEKTEEEYEADGDYHFNELTDLYLVYVPHKTKPMQIPGKLMREWNEAYSNMSAGGSETINQICKTWGISRKDFVAIKKAMRMTHDQDPYTDEEHLAGDPADLAENLVQKKRHAFEKHFRKKEWKEIERDALRWRELGFYLGVNPNLKSVKETLEDISSIERYCKNINVDKVVNKINIDTSTGSTLIIPVSDLHVGKKFETKNPKTKNFNITELKKRLGRAMSYVEMLKPQVENRVTHLIYSSLGDNFEAIFGNMRPGQHLTMDLMGIDQYKEVVEFHVNFIDFLRTTFPKVKITAIFQGGNHDRIFADKRWDSEEVLNYIVTDRIASEFSGVPETELEVLIGEPVASLTLSNGVNLITQHGHLKGLKGNNSIVNFINIHGDKKAQRYLVSQGHFHHWEMVSGYNYKFYMNSSFCGNDNYNLDKVGVGSPAEFMMIESAKNNDIFYGPYNLEEDEF
jgi:hypothetical protein